MSRCKFLTMNIQVQVFMETDEQDDLINKMTVLEAYDFFRDVAEPGLDELGGYKMVSMTIDELDIDHIDGHRVTVHVGSQPVTMEL